MITSKKKINVYVKVDPESADLPVAVFKAELDAIKNRRANLGLSAVDDDDSSSGPAVQRGLYGLALSGGGIRSSTFNLGMQQALERCGLLRHVDYLSTVSGGGYIGSCISSFWAGHSRTGFDAIEIIGIPDGCTLSKGKNLGEGRWRLAVEQIKDLTMHLPLLEPDRKYETVIKAIAIKRDEKEADELGEKQLFLPIETRLGTSGGLKIESVNQDETPCLAISGKLDSQDISVPLVLAPLYHFPFRHKAGKPESKAFRHLRDYSNYLTPPCPFAGLRLPGLFLRGFFVNALIILPLLLFLAVATVFLAKNDIHDALDTKQLDYVIEDQNRVDTGADGKKNADSYKNIIIDLRSQIEWIPHEENLDILISGLSEDAIILPEDAPATKVTSRGKDCRLLRNQDPDNLRYDIKQAGEKSTSIKVMAWEHKKTTKLIDGAPWLFKKKPDRTEPDLDRVISFISRFPWMFDSRKAVVPLTNEAVVKNTVSLDLTPHIDWKKYIILSGLPKNSYSIKGEFLDNRRWLFDGEAAQNLKLKFDIPDLHENSHIHVLAWQSIYPDKTYQTVQGPKQIIELFYLQNKFRLRSWPSDFSGNKNDIAPKVIELPDSNNIKEILTQSGFSFGQEGRGHIYLRIANIPEGAIIAAQPPDVAPLFESKREWLFMDDEIKNLHLPLLKGNLNKLTAEKPLKIVAWQSGNDGGVYDPISLLYRKTFNITKWLLVVFVFLLTFYPLLQRVMLIFGMKSWRRRDFMTRYVCGFSLAVIGTVAFLEFQPLAIYLFYRLKSALTVTGIFGGAEKALTIAITIVAVTGGIFTTRSMGNGSKLTAKIGLAAMGVIGPAVLWLFYLNLSGWALASENVPKMFANVEGYVICVFLGVGLATYLLSQLFYNVNRTSFHPFYRDRLSKAFLIKKDPRSGEIIHNDEQKLQDLDTSCSPFHIINTTLNITGKSTANLKGRTASFFSFSREYVGSQITGYARTAHYEDLDKHMGLGTAMAISGAAAAPNMGRETNKNMTFIMALFNIRLGYWARNPHLMDPDIKKSLGRKLLGLVWPDQVGPFYLIKEMLGLINEKSSFVNLSDGGHLENMGLYELVRRRCKYIIIGDGEADKDMTFHGLSDAVRMVLIDMGIKIDIDLDHIYRKVKNEDGSFKIVGSSHYAVGTIHYGKSTEKKGYLLYIKSSVSTKHAPYIEDYMARNPDFPHETTADQFFDEAQFEAYRALGMEVGEKTRKELVRLSEMNDKEKEAFGKDRKDWEIRATAQWSKALKAI